MKKSIISIIVPVYKTEKCLNKCIESIVNQTYKNLEIILVDDGSPDKCPMICDEWAEKDKRIKVLHIANNGVANARNAGLDIMNGEYVAFIDSDDWIDLDMLDYLKKELEKNNADIACINFYFEYLNKKTRLMTTNRFTLESKSIVTNYIKDKIRPEVCGKLYKSSIIKNYRFNTKIKYGEDLLYNYYVMKNANKFINLDVCKYHYLQNSGNSSTTAYITDARAKSYIITKEIVIDTKGTNLYKIAVWRHIRNTYAILSRVVKSDDNYFIKTYFNELKNEILLYKSNILFERCYSIKQKIATILLDVSPKLFKNLL